MIRLKSHAERMRRALRPARAIAVCLVAAVMVPSTHGAGPIRPPAPSDWFHVFAIDDHTYAISEPKYWQQNVSYLILGTRRALLFDTGPGLYSIAAEVRRLTALPVIAIPSHLHFDHVGDLEEFADVRLLDQPELRAQVRGGVFVEPPRQYMLRSSFKYRVKGWVRDGETIDLGSRTVQVISTPGHTPDSVSVVDRSDNRLFTGDLANRMGSLYAVPGSDVAAAANSLRHLLENAPQGALAYEAHAEAPLTRAELTQLASGLEQVVAGHSNSSTVVCLGPTPMRRLMIGQLPVFLPGPHGELQDPLGSATETVDFGGSACH